MEQVELVSHDLLKVEDVIVFNNICKQNGITLTNQQVVQLSKYVDLLLNWNKKINLISRKDELNVWIKHILHSVSVLFMVEIPLGSMYVDIGTGGGLPGIPIKILREDLSGLLLDSTRKKAEAVSEIIRNIGMKGINVEWGRAEVIGRRPEYNHKFDFAFARAVAPIAKLVEWAAPLLKKCTLNQREHERQNNQLRPQSPALIAFKGGDFSKEIKIAQKRYPSLEIEVVDLSINETVVKNISEKKLTIVYF